MWVKICGILTIEAALCSIDAGADAIGFVFAESRRKIAVEAANKIIRDLPGGIEKVGVFVDSPHHEVAAIAGNLGLDLLQFHGRESPEYCRLFPGKAIKSFALAGPADLDAIAPYNGSISACLLDTFQLGQNGGTGTPWNWSLMSNRIEQSLAGMPFIAAGGLNARNVAEAIQILKPYGIDTSSGVEKEGGKNCHLIREFIKEARRWENGQFA